MRNHEYINIFKYKLIVPAVYIVSWLMMIIGPFFFDKMYQVYCVLLGIYAMLKGLQNLVGVSIASYKFNRLMKRVKSG